MPLTIVSAHCRTQCCAQCRWTFWIAAQEIELFWHTLPHTIHNASHNCGRTLPRTILNCRAGNGIILTLLQNFHNFSLSSVTPRAVNIYLQHVECVFEFKWLFITVTNSISHDPSSIGCTTQRLVLQQLFTPHWCSLHQASVDCPYTFVGAHCRTQFFTNVIFVENLAQCRTQLWAPIAAHNSECTLPHSIL